MIDPFTAFEEPFCQGLAWMWLEAHVDAKGRIETSYRRLGEAWGWNQVKVMRTLEKWRTATLIVTDKTAAGTLITLKVRACAEAATVTGSVTPPDDLFGGVEIISIRTQKQATRLPETWRLTKPLGLWAMERGFTETEVRREAERFRLHWLGASGKSAVKKSWDAAWRTWIMNAEDRRQRNAGATDGALEEMKAKYPGFNTR